VIWDSVDCISHLFSQASVYSAGLFGRFITRFELSRTRKTEGSLITQFDHVLVTSKTDRNALLELAPSNSNPSPISVLSNGVDLEYFHQNPARQRELNTLVFSGKMSYHANIAMVKRLVTVIMPMIWEKNSNVQLKIVGKDPTTEILAFEADPRITVTGTVADIRPFLWDSTVAVIPLVYGAGIQNKVLEAMACGTPVVTTSKALLSLKAIPGKELLVADDDVEFSRNVMKLLDDRDFQNMVGSNGAFYVRKHHSWSDITKELLIHYDEIANKLKGKYFSPNKNNMHCA
jgi:glycosyltransferase involved in cell wall biosynthesis